MIYKAHIRGTLVDTMNRPMPNAYIISIMSDSEGVKKGMRSEYQVNDKGEYNFYLVGGYHRLYTLTDIDSVEKYVGLVHITDKQDGRLYTLEDAIALCK